MSYFFYLNSQVFELVDIQFMDPSPTNLVSATKLLLTENASDTHLFQNTYAQIAQLSYNEEESLANKVGPLSQAQVYQLRSQILAYKHLVRNIPVPTALGIPVVHSNIWTNERQKLAQKAVTFYRDKIQKEIQIKNMITGNIKAQKDDPKDYEEQVRYMVEKRRNEIEKILEKNQLTEDARMKLQIQFQFLQPNVRNVYHRVLNRIVEGFQQDKKSLKLFETQLLDRDYYRREKLQRNRDVGNRVEKLQNQMKTDHQKRKKRKHKQMLQLMRTHKAEFDEFHRKKEKERKKIAAQSRDLYEKRKKNEDEIQNKQARKRLELLKQHNYTEYFNELKKAKNSKINELFSQTNKFLKQLGAKVLIQKGNDQDQRQDDYNQNEAQDDIANAFQNANSIYYNLTHTVKEEITKQPTILSGGELKNYQLQGLQWLVSLYNNKLNGILADQMGLGKTIQTISLLAYLIEFKKNYGPFLIVVPLSTISNWMAEFDKWAPSIKRVVYRGNPATRTDVLKTMKGTRWNVCITTYDFILKDRQKLNKYHWKYIVIDQGHKMKNAKSKFAGVLGTQYQSDHRLLLTGTPLQNNLGQLWALLNFLLPKVFSSCEDFQKWFSIALTKQTGGQNVQLTEEEQLLIINRLHQVLRPFLLRRIKKQVAAQLPDKTQYVIKIQLSAWQKMIYQRLSQRGAVLMGVSSDSGKVSNTALNNLVMQLRKCCNHPFMFLKNYDEFCYHDMIFRSSGKFQLLDRILPKLKQFNHRVLIFTQMTHLMNIMQIYFDYKGVKHLRLDGATKQRGEMTQKFNSQNSMYDVFLLSTRAGGLGLNLQSADTVIIFDSDWNPQMDLQAQDRAHRIGQKKQVKVLRFLSINTIEQDIYARATRKKNMDQILIQGGMYNLNSSESQRRQKIEDILKKTGNPEDKKDQIPDDEMINKILSRNEEQFDRFTKMDEQRYKMQPQYYRNIKQQGEDDDVNPGTCRLMTEDQIPMWFKQTANKTEQNKEYGRGNRVRKQVNYCDDLTDQQFNNFFLEDNQDPEESNPLPKQKPKRGRKPQKQGQSQGNKMMQEKQELEEDNDNDDEQFNYEEEDQNNGM